MAALLDAGYPDNHIGQTIVARLVISNIGREYNIAIDDLIVLTETIVFIEVQHGMAYIYIAVDFPAGNIGIDDCLRYVSHDYTIAIKRTKT